MIAGTAYGVRCVDLFAVSNGGFTFRYESSGGINYRVAEHPSEKNGFDPHHIYPDYSPIDILLGFTAGHVYVLAGGHRLLVVLFHQGYIVI